MGLGAISFEHIEKLLLVDGVEIAGICDLDPRVGAAVAERFAIGPVFTDTERLLAESRPDVVHVLTPPATHPAIVRQALDAGAHVLVEKPIAASWDAYAEMRDAAARTGLLLVENYNWRLSRPVRRAQELHRSGALGEVVHVDAVFGGVMRGALPADHFSNSLPGGALHNFATHPVSLAVAFIDRADEVASSRLDGEMRALLTGRSATALVSVTRHAEPPAFTLRVAGTGGTIEVDLYNDRLFLARPGGGASKVVNAVRRGVSELGGSAALVAKTASSRLDHFEGLEFLIRELYGAIARGGEPPITIAEMDAVNDVMNRLFAPDTQP